MTERTYAFGLANRSLIGLFWCVVAALGIDAMYNVLKHSGLERVLVLQVSLPVTGAMILIGILTCVYITRLEALFENPMWHRRCRSARRGAILSLLGFVGIIGGGFLLQMDSEINSLAVTCIMVSWLAHIVGGFQMIIRSCQWGQMIGRMFNRELLTLRSRRVLACAVIAMIACLLLLLVSIVRGLTGLYSEGEIILFSAVPIAAAFGLYTMVRYLMLLRSLAGDLLHLAKAGLSGLNGGTLS